MDKKHTDDRYYASADLPEDAREKMEQRAAEEKADKRK